MATKLTKAQLLEKIDQLERELQLKTEEVDALYVQQRPSRGQSRSHDFQPTVALTPFRERCAAARELAIKTGRCVTLAKN